MSHYAQQVKQILASLNDEGDDTNTTAPDQWGSTIIHVYPTTDGDILLSHRDYDAEEDRIDSQQPAPIPTKASPLFVVFCLLIVLFVLLDMADSQLVTLMTPTVTVTIVPQVKTIALQSTATLGKLLAPLTLSESQTVPATGHSHQDAEKAAGLLTIYNAAFTPQTVAAGTVFFTGSDGIAIVTTETATIPADTPPVIGQGSIASQAANPGVQGNIPALDINYAVSSSLYVKNLAAFTGGQNERDFQIVRKADLDTAITDLTEKVTASMTAALQQQLTPTEQMHQEPCSPHVAADHPVGDEAASVTVTVALSCTAIAYDVHALQQRAIQLLKKQATTKLGTVYARYGDVTVAVTKVGITTKTVVLTFSCQANWIYQINEESLQVLVSGKPRLEALQLLTHLPGIARASISGIADDNDPLPTEAGHLKFLLIYATF